MSSSMPRRPSRAHSQLLGLAHHLDQATDQVPLRSIQLRPAARHALIRTLYLTGHWQWGPLFGEQQGSALIVHHFAPAGPRWVLNRATPFEHDATYLLGYADAVLARDGGRVDWAGVWLAPPDSGTLAPSQALAWLERAAEGGLVDDWTPLITAGYTEGALSVEAAVMVDGQPQRLPVRVR